MGFEYNAYALLSLISAAALGGLGALAWGRRGAPGARAFAALMLAGSWWKLAYAFGLASGGLEAKVFWAKVAYLGVVVVPLAWLALALGYAGLGSGRARRRALTLLALPLLAALALVWTNGTGGGSHGLFWASASVDRSGPFAALEVEDGPWFPAYVAYSYALVLVGTVLVAAAAVRSPRSYLPQGFALLAGVIVTWCANALYLSGIEPVPNLNPSVLVFPLTGALFALGLFRFGLLDLSPVARDAAFTASGDGLVVVDPRGRVVDANPAAERILDLRARRLIGADVSGLMPVGPADGAGLPAGEDLQGVSLGKPPRRYDLAQSPLVARGGRRVGRLLALRDVTERELARESLEEANQRLRELASLRADFMAMVAHEVGTPLAAVRGHADILGLDDIPPEVREDSLARVREEIRGIATLVADVRSAAAVENGVFDLRPRPVRAGDLLEDAARFARTLPGNHPLVVEGDAAEETVRADLYRAGQVLRNLLTNAAKYSPENVPILLRAVRDNSSDRVRLEVADRGAGVGPEDTNLIFEKFGRGREPGAHGVGLGLYLSRRIARAHGGDVVHRPNPDGGSVFYLELPTEPAPEVER